MTLPSDSFSQHSDFPKRPDEIRSKFRWTMSLISAVVLRALLCLGLVLNGQSSALASIEMAGGQHGGAAPAASSGPAAPCEHHKGSSVSSGPGSVAANHAPAALDDSNSMSDCCRSGGCNCACAQHASSPVPVRSFVGVDITAAGNFCSLRLGRASPTDPNLIRPPIS